MHENPLAMPKDTQVLSSFMEHFGLNPKRPKRNLLVDVARAFSRLPYENLTKILKEAQLGKNQQARRLPGEVVGDHRSLGTGGTCFSLAAALLHLVRSLGWEAQPILADRRYGQNTHCALLIWIDSEPHLLDPGYLIVDPIPLELGSEKTIETSFNQLVLIPHDDGDKIDLHTVAQDRQTYRLTFKTQPADAGEFLKWWDASFDWDMMRYPVLTRIVGDQQLYLQGKRFQARSHREIRRDQVAPEEMIGRIAAEFGIDRSVAIRALSVLNERGEGHG